MLHAAYENSQRSHVHSTKGQELLQWSQVTIVAFEITHLLSKDEHNSRVIFYLSQIKWQGRTDLIRAKEMFSKGEIKFMSVNNIQVTPRLKLHLPNVCPQVCIIV